MSHYGRGQIQILDIQPIWISPLQLEVIANIPLV